MTAVSCKAPTVVLLDQLGRAFWGPLAGRQWQGVRSTLRALVTIPRTSAARGRMQYSGEVICTAWQVSGANGLSEKWTRTCLQLLEQLGVIEWFRGGIKAGKPMAGGITIVKARLVELIELARALKDKHEAAHARRVNERIQQLGRAYLSNSKNKGKRFSSSAHAELGYMLTPLSGDSKPEGRLASRPRKDFTSSPLGVSTEKVQHVRRASIRSETASRSLDPKANHYRTSNGICALDGFIPNHLRIKTEQEAEMKLPPKPKPDPNRFPTVCPHNEFSTPIACPECIEAAIPPLELDGWKRLVNSRYDPTYFTRTPEQHKADIQEDRAATQAIRIAKAHGLSMVEAGKLAMKLAKQPEGGYPKEPAPLFDLGEGV